jgi:2-dehydropantoate 2-reductase
MRIAVVGAGAIGGYLGARLALAGDDVTFIARGPNLDAIRQNGLRLVEIDGAERIARAAAVSSAAEAGAQDLVLLAVKAHQVSALAPDLPPLLGTETPVVTLQNGVPWWFFHKLPGLYQDRVVHAADPTGTIANHIENRRVIGSVVYPAAERTAPGVIKVIEGNRFTLGEPDGARTARIEEVSQHFTDAGFKAPISTDIRSEIWLKLWGNLIFNPVSALTHATLDEIGAFPPTRALAVAIMEEARQVAEKLGLRIRISIENRIDGAVAVGAHKTSMLQDVEAGHELELEALVGGVIELARLTETPTPAIDAVHACAALLGKTLTAAGGRLRIEPIEQRSAP